MRIFLVGYMYCGKSTVGRQLAARLGLRFLDLDQLFESRYRLTIPIFFNKYGEQAFRQLESRLLRQAIDSNPDMVLSTGGGTPCFHDNMALMNRTGITLYLQLDPDAICARAAVSKKQRPLLAGMNPEQRRATVASQLDLRMPFYSQARLQVDAKCPNIDDIEALVRGLL